MAYRQDFERETKYSTKAHVRGAFGVGIAGKYGVGREMSVTLPMIPGEALLMLLDGKTPAELLQLEGKWTLQDRWEAGIAAKLGFEISGNQCEGAGSMFWKDRGRELSEQLSIEDGLRSFASREAIEKTIEDLHVLANEARLIAMMAQDEIDY